jgi:hypothetical protein
MPFGDRYCHNIKVIDNNNTIIISLMRTQEEQQKNRAKVARHRAKKKEDARNRENGSDQENPQKGRGVCRSSYIPPLLDLSNNYY